MLRIALVLALVAAAGYFLPIQFERAGTAVAAVFWWMFP